MLLGALLLRAAIVSGAPLPCFNSNVATAEGRMSARAAPLVTYLGDYIVFQFDGRIDFLAPDGTRLGVSPIRGTERVGVSINDDLVGVASPEDPTSALAALWADPRSAAFRSLGTAPPARSFDISWPTARCNLAYLETVSATGAWIYAMSQPELWLAVPGLYAAMIHAMERQWEECQP
jgi:hypothetical protein